MKQNVGYFVISLDFELFWGMFDKVTLLEYGERIRGERTAIPRMLELFKKYGIHATWATVGMLMARNKDELYALLPPEKLRPQYEDMSVSSYEYLQNADLGTKDNPDIHHFGYDLVKKILGTPFQEIGNHTFSHFYCIDGKENRDDVFEADLVAHEKIAHYYELKPATMVFPRNQAHDSALKLIKKHGILAYRGNEHHHLYKPRKDSEQSLFIRGLRLLDHYINLTGHHTYPLPRQINVSLPIDIPSSRFFRPWSKLLQFFEPLRMRRIKSGMTHAATRGEVFHLWWHPHNVGIDQEENFKNLEDILKHYTTLQKEHGMVSASMIDIARLSDEQAL